MAALPMTRHLVMRHPMTLLRRRLHNDDGSILPVALIFVAGLATVVLSFISAQEGWAVRRNAQLAAAAAARAGAQVEPVEWRASQSSAPGAAARAEAVLASQGYHGSVQVAADHLVVTVVAPIQHTFAVPWLPTEARATASAELVRGTDGTQE